MEVDEIIETIMQNRGIEDREHFVNPTEKDLLPLTDLLYIDKAKDIVSSGLDDNKRFKVFFDTDLDGISSGTIMYRVLKHYTNNVECIINQGKAHGLLGQNLQSFMDTDILIIVDSLDKDTTAYKELSDEGIQIIVLDHHSISDKVDYDKYVTLVSSQRNYNNPALSGAGVVWKFCKYLDEYFLEDYADRYADLAACGLIADMSDMSQKSMENRYIVSKGLEQINNPAIKKIVGTFPFNSTAISFSIAPLVNAANRMSKNESAMNAFLADENKEVLKYVKELKKCKEEQNVEVDVLMNDILEQADKQIDKKVISIFIDSEADISGLIGNKLLEKYQRPLLILKYKEIDGKKYIAGSARAIGVKDFRKMCNDTGLCEANGHELAHGVQILEQDYNEFINRLENKLKDVEFEVNTVVDIELNLSDITRDLIDEIKKIDLISGEGFRPVVAKVSDVTEYEIGNMSQGKHLVVKPNAYTQFIKWNFNGSFEDMEDNSMLGEPITFIGTLDSGWLGRTFSLKMICNEFKVG